MTVAMYSARVLQLEKHCDSCLVLGQSLPDVRIQVNRQIPFVVLNLQSEKRRHDILSCVSGCGYGCDEKMEN